MMMSSGYDEEVGSQEEEEEEQSTNNRGDKTTKKRHYYNKKQFIAGAIVALCTLSIIIGVSVGVSRRNKDNNNKLRSYTSAAAIDEEQHDMHDNNNNSNKSGSSVKEDSKVIIGGSVRTANVGCSDDVYECSDGSFARRNPNNECEFYPCETTTTTTISSKETAEEGTNGDVAACIQDVQECPDGTFVGRDPSNGCEFFPCDDKDNGGDGTIACLQDTKECPDGSFVGRDEENDCEFFPCESGSDNNGGGTTACIQDVKECPDGSFVGRDETNDCEFFPCKSGSDGGDGTVACDQDVQECPDGSFVGRDENNDCEFLPCKSGSDGGNNGGGTAACIQDVKECPDGTFVNRDENNDCEFFPCDRSRDNVGGCPKDVDKCPDGSSVGRDPSNNCEFYQCMFTFGCTGDRKKCPDGSFVGRDRSNDCEFFPCGTKSDEDDEPPSCPEDSKLCPDGSSVGRDPYNECNFYSCRFTFRCSSVEKECPDGTYMSRDQSNGCQFRPCSTGSSSIVDGSDGDTIACTEDAKICPDGFSVGRDISNNCEFFPCDNKTGCIQEVKECPDGSFVRRDSSNECEFFPCEPGSDGGGPGIELGGCTKDGKQCPDGSTVGRDPSNDCEFYPCKFTFACTKDLKTCPDGTSVGRDKSNECEFFPCEDGGDDNGDDNVRGCTKDIKRCPDGSTVIRNPSNDCEFDPCESEENNNSSGTSSGTTFASEVRKSALPLMSRELLKKSYSSCEDLSEDLTKMADYIAQSTIEQNAKNFFQFGGGPFFRGGPPELVDFADSDRAQASPPVPEAQISVSTGGSGQGTAAISTSESNFGTNNQVDGVEEADIVKSDGTYVYASYGNEIVKLQAADVEVVSRTSLPKQSNKECPDDLSISSMLLMSDRLVVIANSYCYIRPDFPPPRPFDIEEIDETETESEQGDEEADEETHTDGGEHGNRRRRTSSIYYPGVIDPRILQDNSKTHVLIYDLDSMALLDSTEIKGSYTSARAIGNNVHLIINNYLSYFSFTRAFEPWSNSEVYGNNVYELGAEKYRELAEAQIEEHKPAFVKQMTEELDCTTLKQIALLQNNNDILPFGGGFDSMASIHSFDATKSLDEMSVTSSLLPSGGWNVYSSADFLVLSTNGWHMGGTDADQELYVMTYKLDGPTAEGAGFGTVPGYALNQFSFDHVVQEGSDFLRIATTTRERWSFVPLEVDDADLENIDLIGVIGRRATWEPVTSSTSQVTILEVSDSDEKMPVVGQLLDLGKPGEQIYSVRFQGDRGFVVTFEQTDPFYTLDLADPTNPKAVGELEIPGFSNYLHPVGDDLIIGVGQAADDTGRTQGLQISLFDVSDFAQPKRIQNFIEDTGDSSSSDAQYDHKAFRYLDESELLIIPVTIYDYSRRGGGQSVDGFDGFRIYQVNKSDISTYFSIEHASGDFYSGGCWSRYGHLSARSLVFDGDIMTMKGHSILSHDLSTREADAEPINLDADLDEEECVPYYF